MANPELIRKWTQVFNEQSQIVRYFGMKLSFDEQYAPVVELPYNSNLTNITGGIHGGVCATMLDIAGWFAAVVAHDQEVWLATSEMSVHYLEAAKKGPLRATARLIKSGKRQHVAEMQLYDGEGQLVAHATGTFIVLPSVSLE